MKRILWFDLETTGTDKVKHGIIQIAAMIERDNRIIAEREWTMNPVNKLIDPKALEVNGMTVEQIRSFLPSHQVYSEFNMFLDQHGFRKQKDKRYIPGGYNAGFDLDFISQWYLEMSGGPYAFWGHLQFQPIDPYPTIVSMWRAGVIPTENCKLETICNHFGIPIDAHDAMSDIRASRELARMVLGRINTVFAERPWGLIDRIRHEDMIPDSFL
jgi:DNA polymerase III subunit epsilon